MAKVFLIGNHRPSLAIARTLHRNGHEVWAGLNGYSDYFELSRAVANCIEIPDFDHKLAAIGAIEAALKLHQFDAVWPVTDRATKLLADYRERIEAICPVVSPSAETVGLCRSKTRMAQLCREQGVPVASYTPVSNHSQLVKACRGLGFPVIVKPTGEGEFLNGQKVVCLEDEDGLATALPTWPREHTHLMVQKRLDGFRHNHYFVAWEGQLLTAASVEILRTDRADGSGYAVEGITTTPRPDLVKQTETLVRALGYTGIGCLQYVTCRRSDETSFLELNPRVGANIAGADAAGPDLIMQALELAIGDNLALDETPWALARPGMRYAWSKGDASGLIWRLRHGAGLLATLRDLGELVRTALTARTHLVFSWRDPLPALASWLHPVLRRLPGSRLPSASSRAKAG